MSAPRDTEAGGPEPRVSEQSLNHKIRWAARQAGREVVEKALILYYAARDPETPWWARRAVYGALVYFIIPLDAIPDFIPGIGYTDDLGVLVAALGTIAVYVTPDMRRRAREAVEALFGPREA